VRRLRILTAELVPLEVRLAGLPERAIAAIVDELLVTAVTSALWGFAVMLGGFTGGVGLGAGIGAVGIASFVLSIGYRWWAEVRWNGRTYGKKLLNLRVLQSNGTPILPWQAFVRNVARVVDQLPFFHLVGAACVVIDGKARRVGDMLAGTVVVREVRREAPLVPRTLIDAQNSLLADGGAAARIRTRLSDREAVMLSEFVAGSARIDTARRLRLSERIARHYRDRLHLDAHDGLPDEVLLRGIVGVLLRDRFGSAGRAARR